MPPRDLQSGPGLALRHQFQLLQANLAQMELSRFFDNRLLILRFRLHLLKLEHL